MKILFTAFSIAVALFFTACNNNRDSRQNDGQMGMSADSISRQHDTGNTDYDGTYAGTMPCADCEGIETEIKLDNGKYKMKYVYLGAKDDNTFEEEGTYTWDGNKNQIMLDGDTLNRYLVGEDMLVALDADGNRIDGEFADMYILRKK